MNEIEYAVISASIPLMTVEELEALRLEMGRRHDSNNVTVFAQLADACSYQLDWREELASQGISEEEYYRCEVEANLQSAYCNDDIDEIRRYEQQLKDMGAHG